MTVAGIGIDEQMQEKVAGTAFLSSSDPRLHFGVGDTAVVDVTVDWPDGTSDAFVDVRANSFVRITQGGVLEVVQELPLVELDGPSFAVRRLSEVSFTASAQPAEGRTIVGYEWDFGDGTTSNGGTSARHAFSDIGRFTIRVTAVDSAGDRATEWRQVRVWDFLQTSVEMDQDVFGPLEQPRGLAFVTFPDGTPVNGASIQLTIQRTMGDPLLDDRIDQLPFFLHQFLGWVPIEITGTTDAAGEVPFVVPHNVVKPSPLVPLDATHPGEYRLVANSFARGSSADPFETLYRVVVPDV